MKKLKEGRKHKSRRVTWYTGSCGKSMRYDGGWGSTPRGIAAAPLARMRKLVGFAKLPGTLSSLDHSSQQASENAHNIPSECLEPSEVSSTLHLSMPTSLMTYDAGVLVECDPSIKAIIMRINEQQGHDIVIEDIDDEHVLIKSAKHEDLKFLLKEVHRP